MLDRTRMVGRGWWGRSAALGPLSLARVGHDDAAGLSGPGDPDLFVLTIPTAGAGAIGPPGRMLAIAAGLSATLFAEPAIAAEVEPGFAALQVLIPRSALASPLAALLGAESGVPLVFAPAISIATGPGAELARLLGFLADEALRPGCTLASPLVGADLAAAALHLMLIGLRHNHRDVITARAHPAEPRYLRRAESLLEANVDRPVSSVRLAAEVGVSVRALQAAFRRYRGSSPSRFVRDRRLELARRHLTTGDGASVAEVALACGFGHLGRFSVEYRARFGESPSTTRRRGPS